jgi:hypothetical protein
VYLSADASFIPNRSIGLGGFTHASPSPLGPGQSYTESHEVTLPRGIGGTYYIYILTGYGDTLGRATGDNSQNRNYFAGRAFEDTSNNLASTPIPVTYREPNLIVSDVHGPVAAPSSGSTIGVTWVVTNAGTRDTREGFWIDRVYLSRDASLDSSTRCWRGLSPGVLASAIDTGGWACHCPTGFRATSTCWCSPTRTSRQSTSRAPVSAASTGG